MKWHNPLKTRKKPSSKNTYTANRLYTIPNMSDNIEINESDLMKYKDRCVLIGVVRGKRQFAVNLNKMFYHIPVSQATDCQFPVRFIGIYQSKRFFGRNAGINYLGEVESCSTLPRSQIKEIPRQSDEKYFYFKIKSWFKLKTTIKANEMNVTAFSTTPYLLGESKFTSELTVRNSNEHEMYKNLTNIVTDLVKKGCPDGPNIVYEDHTIMLKKGVLCVYFRDMIECAVGFDIFLEEPMKIIREIFDYYPEK